MVVDTIITLVSYAVQFESQSTFKFVNGRITDIFDDTLSFDYLQLAMRATYLPCLDSSSSLQKTVFCLSANPRTICTGRLALNNSTALLPLLEQFSPAGGTWRNLALSRLHCSILFTTELEEGELVVGNLEYFKWSRPRAPCSMSPLLILLPHLRLLRSGRCKQSLLFGSIPAF